jgi:hypothetical protein
VWDNITNDALMSDRLPIGPMWGRDHQLVDDGVVTGWLVNPPLQPHAGLLTLASVAAWLRREDPLDAWAAEADQRGWRVFAEACDGAVPKAIVALVADAFAGGHLEPAGLDALRTWFSDAREVSAPGLELECEGWLDQIRAEAAVALDALDIIERVLVDDDDPDAPELASSVFVLGFKWKALLGAPVSVMGPRLGFAPVLGQAGDGTWAVRRSSLLEGANAVDALCRLAFEAAAWAGERA